MEDRTMRTVNDSQGSTKDDDHPHSSTSTSATTFSRLLQSVNIVGISSYVSLLSMYVTLKLKTKVTSVVTTSGGPPPREAVDVLDAEEHAEEHDRNVTKNNSWSRIVPVPPILPTMETADIRNIDWERLYTEHNIRGVLFDKDHTLTMPYALSLHPYAVEALEEAKRVFGSRNVVLYSNSAGLKQYDPDGVEAGVLEECLGVHVLRHGYKKPYVSDKVRGEVEGWFGVGVEQLVMVGDRYMTDVMFGNRMGMMTVRVKPFVEVRGGGIDGGVDGVRGKGQRDPKSVRLSRRLEEALVRGFREMMCENA